MSEDSVEITRYPNRRLYDKSRGQYVTLQDIEDLVREGKTVTVTDSKSGDDLTRAILAQIVLERHPERMDLLPVSFLHLMLRANDMALDWMRTYLRQVFSYLEGLPFPTAAPPLAVPLDWMKFMTPGFGVTPSPPPDSPTSAAALAARVEQLERRLKEIEAEKSK